MVARHRAQLEELLTNYGEIHMLSLDQWLGPRVWPEVRKTILKLRELQPNVMLRARGIGNYGDYYTPEGFVPVDKSNSTIPGWSSTRWRAGFPLILMLRITKAPAGSCITSWIRQPREATSKSESDRTRPANTIRSLLSSSNRSGDGFVFAGRESMPPDHARLRIGVRARRSGSRGQKTIARCTALPSNGPANHWWSNPLDRHPTAGSPCSVIESQ
jgi:hypothetical protein